MANWITCEYYGASLDPSKSNNGLPLNDIPVNLDYCYSFKKNDVSRTSRYQIVFQILKDEPIVWEFINAELRDKEYNRAMELIKKI
jgi:hypothetical protein